MKQIPLTKGKVAIVDDEDFEYLNQFKWHATCYTRRGKSIYYAKRNVTEGKYYARLIPMQNVIMNVPRGTPVDHIDRNGLNNRRNNLRVCTNTQNQHNQGMRKSNTSGYKGAFRSGKRWRAQIKLNRVAIHLGCFDTPEEAARAYDKAAKENYGEFAYLNFKD